MIKLFISSFLILSVLNSQPKKVKEGIEFIFIGKATKVFLAGDFNSWSTTSDELKKINDSTFQLVKNIRPGFYQYKFFVDDKWILDLRNSATIPNPANSYENSFFVLDENLNLKFEKPSLPNLQTSDTYPKKGKTLYLNIIWHQHQPLYLDPAKDELRGPWVRTHGTKDYYDMASIFEKYPNIHASVNLTSSLLLQLNDYYIARLKDFVDIKNRKIDAKRFLKKWRGKTDPWIDLMLMPTEKFTTEDLNYLLKNNWNAFGISEVMIERFPEYKELKEKNNEGKEFTIDELRKIKFFFYLAYFDTDFLNGKVKLISGDEIDLSDFVKYENGKYYLKKNISERDCNRLIAEMYLVLSNIIPIHKSLLYNFENNSGQIEVSTTPYYHPILPLIYNSDEAKTSQPNDKLPNKFSYKEDAKYHIEKAVAFYKNNFGIAPSGMWPGEGAVSHDVTSIISSSGIKWIATDEKVLNRSLSSQKEKYYPYTIINGKDTLLIVFRDTELSDKIGFTYQQYFGEDAADDFIKSVLNYSPSENENDRLLTVILDGENAWEWYKNDIDGKDFLNALYRKLSRLYETNQIVTVTPMEFIFGNPKRNISKHPLATLPKIEKLHSGSWINANYDTWIGEKEENLAWEYLRTAREEIEKSGIKKFDAKSEMPKLNTKNYFAYKAWDAIYAAEGSDWFWWYGTDQQAPAGDTPFDEGFRTHLENAYRFAKLAGGKINERKFEPIILKNNIENKSQGAMARSQTFSILFECDAKNVEVTDRIFIVGNILQLSMWTPNKIAMYDDGTNGDKIANDKIWTLLVENIDASEIRYKFTNSGKLGVWNPSEEFSIDNRELILTTSKTEVRNIFGVK
ncbi:MAG: carbohydrate-binding module family 20 domain-containing protein [Bacteroidota bacterium]